MTETSHPRPSLPESRPGPRAPSAGGRPSLAPLRREQILDAVEACIIDYGIDGVSFARVASRAGVRTSIVPHYFGSKEALMTVMVDRVLGRVQVLLDNSLEGLEGRPPARSTARCAVRWAAHGGTGGGRARPAAGVGLFQRADESTPRRHVPTTSRSWPPAPSTTSIPPRRPTDGEPSPTPCCA